MWQKSWRFAEIQIPQNSVLSSTCFPRRKREVSDREHIRDHLFLSLSLSLTPVHVSFCDVVCCLHSPQCLLPIQGDFPIGESEKEERGGGERSKCRSATLC